MAMDRVVNGADFNTIHMCCTSFIGGLPCLCSSDYLIIIVLMEVKPLLA